MFHLKSQTKNKVFFCFCSSNLKCNKKQKQNKLKNNIKLFFYLKTFHQMMMKTENNK